jgi:hypothetical protein
LSVRKRYAWRYCEPVGLARHTPLQCASTGLLAWKHGQPGQVGNEAALTVVTSAEIRLVNLIPRRVHQADAAQLACLKAITPWLRKVRNSDNSFSPRAIPPACALSA